METAGIRRFDLGRGPSLEGDAPAVEGALVAVVPEVRAVGAHVPERRYRFGVNLGDLVN